MTIKRWLRELFEKNKCRFASKCGGYSGRGVCNKYGIRWSNDFILCNHYRKLRDEGQ